MVANLLLYVLPKCYLTKIRIFFEDPLPDTVKFHKLNGASVAPTSQIRESAMLLFLNL
jgi:hypothetical protein